MNTAQSTPLAAQPYDPRWLRERRVVHSMRFLPALMFLSFFLSNTRLSPLSGLMLIGRWGAFLALCVLAWAIAEQASSKTWPPFTLLLIAAFASIGTTLASSSNPTVSGVKWGVFLGFLVFCGLVSARVNDAQDVKTLIIPLSWIFIAYIWAFPPSIFLFPQPLRGSLGYVNGFLKFTNAVGQFLVIGGLPIILYRLQQARTQRQQLFFTATLGLGCLEVLAGGSRAAAAALILMMGLAVVRWKTPGSGRANRVRLLCIVLLVLVTVLQTDRVRRFFYKYPDASNLFESRQSYWEATNQSFRSRQWMGTGFGVQTTQAGSGLSFSTTGTFREQGSFFYGLREEVGYIGSVPIIAVLLLLTSRNGWLLVRTKDPSKLLFARSSVAGMLYAVSENYLLYLGNAASILFFFSLFMSERLQQLEHHHRLRQQQQQRLMGMWRHDVAGHGQAAPGVAGPGVLDHGAAQSPLPSSDGNPLGSGAH